MAVTRNTVLASASAMMLLPVPLMQFTPAVWPGPQMLVTPAWPVQNRAVGSTCEKGTLFEPLVMVKIGFRKLERLVK